MRALAVLAILAIAVPAAHADNKKKADVLFKKGKRLLDDKRYADACAAFEQSDKLDPAIGTKLNAARCYQEWGKLARAYRWYTDAEKMAKDTKDDRAPKIRGFVEEVDVEVPRLIIKVPDNADLDAAGLAVDGKRLAKEDFGEPMMYDPGPHEITYKIDGKKQTKTIALERGGEREITIELPPPAEKPTGGDTAGGGDDKGDDKGDDGDVVPVPDPPTPGRGRRIAGIALASAGVVGLGVAAYLTIDARGAYNDAIDAHCMGAPNMCNDEGLAITRDARSQANVATVITLASLAAAAGGVILYVTAPKGEPVREQSALRITPMLGANGGGITLSGGF